VLFLVLLVAALLPRLQFLPAVGQRWVVVLQHLPVAVLPRLPALCLAQMHFLTRGTSLVILTT
jgi:hypothetical protein